MSLPMNSRTRRRHIFLRGICVHENDERLGKVSGEADLRRRFIHAKELGYNYLRLAHYPHHELAARLAAAARKADPTRLVSAACLINRETFAIEDRLAEHLDIIGINEYFGWYEPSLEGLKRLLANSRPGKPVIITETGADAKAGRMGSPALLFSEEHQAEIYRQQIATLATATYIRGITPWILYDFRAERRQTAIQRGWNLKGLIAADKTTKKKAFAVLAAFYRQKAEG